MLVPLACAQSEGATLQSLLKQTLAVHPAQRGKQSLTAAARAGVDAVDAQRYPTLSANVSQTNAQTGSTSNVVVTQPLLTFGLQDARLAVAQSNASLAQLDEWRTARQLLEQTAVAYANALGFQKQLKVSTANLETLEALRQKIKRRQQGQFASGSDVRLIGGRLAQAQVQHDKLAAELGRALESLHTLTQQRVTQVVDVSQSLLAPATAQLPLAQVQGVNPELQYQTQVVAVAQAELAELSASARPTMYAQLARPLSGGGSTTVGVFLEVALEGGGAVLGGRLAAAEARVLAAGDGVQAIRNELAGTLRDLTLQRDALGRSQQQMQLSVNNNRLTYESYLRQYEAGYKSWLDVMNMQRELHEQRLALEQNDTQWLIVQLRLAALAGQLETAVGWVMPIQGP